MKSFGTTIRNLKRMIPFLRPFRWRILGLSLLTLSICLLSMSVPLFVRKIVNDVVSGGRRDMLPAIAVCLFAIPTVNALLSFIQIVGIATVAQSFVLRLRMAVYRHLLSLDIGYFSDNGAGKLTNRLMGDTSAVQSVLNASTIRILSDLVGAIFAITATIALNWRLSIPIFIAMALFLALHLSRIRSLRLAGLRAYRESDKLSDEVQNRLSVDLTVKSYGREDREQEHFHRQSEIAMERVVKAWTIWSNLTFDMELLKSLTHTAVFFCGCALVLRGQATYGDVTAFTVYAMQILVPVVRFTQFAKQLQDVGICIGRLAEILDREPKITDAPDAVALPPRVRGEVDFEHVDFGYTRDKPVLKDFSLHIEPGMTVAFVGPTGCGKTTTLSLLMRLFDVRGGAVKIDGVDVRKATAVSLRGQFGIVLQEPMLFQTSILDNIRYANPDAPREAVEAAARAAEIDADIRKLPKGYDSIVGTGGTQFSLGQKQRVSIARAILADPAILVMDEATSSLDTESERAIQIAMDRMMKNRTAFIVAHRLSTIRNADLIVLLDGGRIVESGRHEELMAIPDGRYKALYEAHVGKGVLDD